MTDPRPLLYALHALAAALAWGYTARVRRHLPLALWATLLPIEELLRRSAADRDAPLWIARTLYLAAPASIAVVAVVVFLGGLTSRRLVNFLTAGAGLAWLALSAFAARRVETPVDLYLAAHLGAVAVGLGAAFARGAQIRRMERKRPGDCSAGPPRFAPGCVRGRWSMDAPPSSLGITDLCASLLVAWWGCDLGGAYLFGNPIGDHWLTQLVAGVALIVLCGVQGGALWLPRR